MEVQKIAAEIESRLRALPDHKTDAVRAVRREFSSRIAGTEPRDVIQLGLRLLRPATPERRFVAYELVQHHRGALKSLRARELEQLGRGIADWGAVDTFGCHLAGQVWRERQVPDRLIHRWARSKDRWWRRAALVSTVPLNSQARGGRGDPHRTLAVCRILVKDRDDMVVKALSWALRELAKRDPKAARRFLAEHGKTLAARVLREVRNKLSTGLKNPRKKQS